MKAPGPIDFRVMPNHNPKLQRNANLFNAWFVRLDKEKRNLLKSGRFRLLFISFALFALLLLNLLGVVNPDSPVALAFEGYLSWMHALEILLLVVLFWEIWRELLQPLLRLCDWADLMRGVNLDARVELPGDSDFNELARDINMLGTMIRNLSRDTEIQLQKHTDHITRESRSLAILYDVASSINISRDLNELFEKSLQSLCANLNAGAGIIRQFKGKNKRDVVASVGDINGTFLASADRFLSIQYPFNDIKLDRVYRVDHLDYETVFGPEGSARKPKLQVLSILLQYRENVLGAIHLFFDDENSLDLNSYSDLLLSIGQHLGSAVEKFRLLEEESELLVMQERTRLSHELHDSLAQTIASLRIQIRVIDETFHSNDEKSIWHQMERIEYTIDQANNQLRELIAYFRVPINQQGLIPSIEEAIRRTQEEAGIPIYFQNEWPEQEFSPDVELNVLRIVQECLANIRKHSQAEVVRVLLIYRDGHDILIIEDDGIGFDESTIVSEGGQHLGLNILRDRASQIGAEIDIESEPGDGTRIHLQFRAETGADLLESTG
ncbi:MAG: histidine kinase [Gammaproteobacteria bacterium]|nr:histidine kinase [Gammaproteobacteria bacterium]MDH3535419.1 histidine kinase [Gammaproteobacteria bacterium]